MNEHEALKLELNAKEADQKFHVLVLSSIKMILAYFQTGSDGISVSLSPLRGDVWFAYFGIDIETSETLISQAYCLYADNAHN